MPPYSVTPPMTEEAQAPMAVPMPGADLGEAQPGQYDIDKCLADLQAAGVEVTPGPNGTVVLTGVPAENLAKLTPAAGVEQLPEA